MHNMQRRCIIYPLIRWTYELAVQTGLRCPSDLGRRFRYQKT
ncbi:hypothetical protein HMPREF1547_02020 [Blautia sp. KLE 1732]|nr:hypothetical protein HMPREF1547_02020 [Blautia sp. KLE 1732]